MKLKNILFTIAATTWLFSSCSEETLVDGPVISGGEEATISATLSINSVETKAAANYEFPQDDAEKKINNYVIVVFDPEKANVVGLSYGEPDAKESFEVEVVAKCYGEKQPILTLVNLPSVQWEACKAYTTYQQFKDLAVEQIGSFKSSELIKIAEQSERLNKGQMNTFDIKVDQLVARIDVSWTFPVEDGASFEISSFTITGINAESDVVLPAGGIVSTNSKNGKSMTSLWEKTTEGNISSFSFYTYEKTTEGSPVVIEITGLLKESVADEGTTRSFKYELNPVKNAACKTTGLVHGNLYELEGTFDLKERNIKWAYNLAEWKSRTTEVNVEKGNYLLVTPLEIMMPNEKENTDIKFQSSSNVRVEDIKIYVKDEPVSTPSGFSISCSGTNGAIQITSPIPTNFVPRVIKFKVRNENTLSSPEITVYQYPPLYITQHQSGDQPGSGWSNTSMFIFNTLVANYSALPYPPERSDYNRPDYSEKRIEFTNYVRSAVTGYPLVDENGYTIDTEENNRRVSPRFMLASQHGTNGAGDYDSKRQYCGTYTERDKNNSNIRYSDWRMPTKAELYMIDVLQNLKESSVTSILGGHWYWSAQRSSAIKTMDYPKDNSGYSATKAAVRCVRDVKDNEMN